jgi:uncharacterized protein with HEPN domain
MVHHLARLGEAVARLSPNVRNRRSVAWKQIIGMRNILVHDYFRIDPETVWTAVDLHLPRVEERVRENAGRARGEVTARILAHQRNRSSGYIDFETFLV